MKNKIYLMMLILSSCSMSDYTEDLGNGYLLVSESNTMQFIAGPNDTTFTGVVPCTVESYASDDFHVIARQKDNPDCSRGDLTSLANNYWIIDKKSEKVYGPLDSLSFNNMKEDLSVSSSLKLY